MAIWREKALPTFRRSTLDFTNFYFTPLQRRAYFNAAARERNKRKPSPDLRDRAMPAIFTRATGRLATETAKVRTLFAAAAVRCHGNG